MQFAQKSGRCILPLAILSEIVYNTYIKWLMPDWRLVMSEMNEFTPELFELIDEHGNKRCFELVDAVEMNGEQYFAMFPAIEDDDFLNANLELIVLKVVEENGEEVLASIDDEDEFEKVYEYFINDIEEAYEDADDDYESWDCGCDSLRYDEDGYAYEEV